MNKSMNVKKYLSILKEQFNMLQVNIAITVKPHKDETSVKSKPQVR